MRTANVLSKGTTASIMLAESLLPQRDYFRREISDKKQRRVRRKRSEEKEEEKSERRREREAKRVNRVESAGGRGKKAETTRAKNRSCAIEIR